MPPARDMAAQRRKAKGRRSTLHDRVQSDSGIDQADKPTGATRAKYMFEELVHRSNLNNVNVRERPPAPSDRVAPRQAKGTLIYQRALKTRHVKIMMRFNRELAPESLRELIGKGSGKARSINRRGLGVCALNLEMLVITRTGKAKTTEISIRGKKAELFLVRRAKGARGNGSQRPWASREADATPASNTSLTCEAAPRAQ